MILGQFRVSYFKKCDSTLENFFVFLTKIRDLISIVRKKSEKTHLFVFTSDFGVNSAFRSKRSELEHFLKNGCGG